MLAWNTQDHCLGMVARMLSEEPVDARQVGTVPAPESKSASCRDGI